MPNLTLVQTASDNFQRANENPLASPPWTQNGTNALQVVSNLCESSIVGSGEFEIYSGTTLAANQYAGATFGNTPSNDSTLYVFVRNQFSSSVSPSGEGYALELFGSGSSSFFNLYACNGSANVIASASNLTVSNGDVWNLAAVGSTIYVLQNGVIVTSATDTTWASGQYSALGIQANVALTTLQLSLYSIGTATATGLSISGNAGVASATVSYSGAAVGSVTADGSGNFSITGLNSGSYVVTPSLSGYVFTPTSHSEILVTSNISGVNFTATTGGSGWSQPDCRVAVHGFGPGPNTGVLSTGGTVLYTGQTSDNAGIPPTDSREAGAPSQDGTYPKNSRVNPLGI
jgi:hypothetical protein